MIAKPELEKAVFDAIAGINAKKGQVGLFSLSEIISDSLDLLNFVVAVEKTLNIEIDDDSAFELNLTNEETLIESLEAVINTKEAS